MYPSSSSHSHHSHHSSHPSHQQPQQEQHQPHRAWQHTSPQAQSQPSPPHSHQAGGGMIGPSPTFYGTHASHPASAFPSAALVSPTGATAGGGGDMIQAQEARYQQWAESYSHQAQHQHQQHDQNQYQQREQAQHQHEQAPHQHQGAPPPYHAATAGGAGGGYYGDFFNSADANTTAAVNETGYFDSQYAPLPAGMAAAAPYEARRGGYSHPNPSPNAPSSDASPAAALPHPKSQLPSANAGAKPTSAAQKPKRKRARQATANTAANTTKSPLSSAGGTSVRAAPSGASAAAAARRRPAYETSYGDSEGEDGFEDDEEEEDLMDDLGGGFSVGTGGVGGAAGGGRRRARPPGACKHCKRLKMKCDFPPGENTCKRCRSGGHVCIVEGRKPRTAPNKREYLLAQIRQKDAIIDSLLKQLHNPYLATPLSIASYRLAMSPSDRTNRNVLDWLERLTASLPQPAANSPAGSNHASSPLSMGAGAMAGMQMQHRSPTTIDEESDEGEDARRGGAEGDVHIVGGQDENEGAGGEGGEEGQGPGGGSDLLPDSRVPLGLIADLSLNSPDDSRAAHSSGLSHTPHRAHQQRKPASTSPQTHHQTHGAGQSAAGGGGGAKVKEEDLEDEDEDNVGVASETYFRPGPATDLSVRATLIERHSPPEILVHGLVTPDEVDELFKIFYDWVNPFISLLDPELHTPASTFARCPFLFTVICSISSRYHPHKSAIYPVAMHFAKHAAATALIDGWKTVELCQAYILMSIYAVPARRWEEDRSWLYTGLAIRIATDLNLHHQSPSAGASGNMRAQREALNRMRVWMICFNLDRSTATQFGKPATIKEDYLMRNSKEWYRRSQYNHPYDVHLCGYTTLLRIVAGFHEQVFSDPNTPSGLNKSVDFRALALQYDQELDKYEQEWMERFKSEAEKYPDEPGSSFRQLLLPFLVSYSRLVMFSFGFQQAYQRGMRIDAHHSEGGDEVFFDKCFESAKRVVQCMNDELVPSGYMRYAPDGHFIFASFASAFLLKLLKPEFASLLRKERESEIFDLIGTLIQNLSSGSIAIDDRHTPKLHARLLAQLLGRHRARDGGSVAATVGRLQVQPQHNTGNAQAHGRYQQSPGAYQTGGQGLAQQQQQQQQQQFGAGQMQGRQFVAPAMNVAQPMDTDAGSHGEGDSRMVFRQEGTFYPGGHDQLQFASGGFDDPFPSAAATATATANSGAGAFDLDFLGNPAFGGSGSLGTNLGGLGAGHAMLGAAGGGGAGEMDQLAAMRALQSPAWWSNMMMPGFSWDASSPSNNSADSSSPGGGVYGQQQRQLPAASTAAGGSYGLFNVQQPQLQPI